MPLDDPHGGGTDLVLKVDVDTRVGLMQGVPRLMDIMARAKVSASFFISMGPDNSGRALKRIFRKGFLAKQLKSGAAASYGVKTMMYGVLLPAPNIARSAPQLFGELMSRGHEVGLHGWDHVYWHDKLRKLPPAKVDYQIRQACDLFTKITGMEPRSFASPGWQITDYALKALAQSGISHVSCTRGTHAFRPVAMGEALPMLELPTTMPTLDELLSREGVTKHNAAAHLLDEIKPGGLNVFTLHAEVEGRNMSEVFEEFLAGLPDRRVRALRLIDAAREAAPLAPLGGVAFKAQSGRAYEVACQTGAMF
jgi:undecaprenyl phosphate-alpha-L-ara4FN deformylase